MTAPFSDDRRAGRAASSASTISALALGAATLAASPAFAHAGHDHAATFAAGLAHPFGGLDHLAAMVGIGVWAAQQGRRAAIVLPSAFVGGVAVGCVAALAGIAAPFVELAILASVVAIAGLMVFKARPALPLGAALAFTLALAHGFAHGMEAPDGAIGPYMAGFAIATALLHAGGVALAVALGRARLGGARGATA